MATLANPSEKQALLDRVSQLRPDSARQWGRMSPHHAVCHLNDSFKVVMGERPTKLVDTLVSRTLFRFIALHTSMPWPKGVPTGAAVDQERGGTKPTEFARDVNALRSLIARFTATPRDFTIRRHPFFGPLTDREWMHWAHRHTDHHLRQFGV